jgi:hypothetical protein
MRFSTTILVCTLAILVGCSADGNGIHRGTPITHVQLDYGLPDVIADRSGDLKRYYVPSDRPESEWPTDAPRTFYYLERNLEVTFVSGRAIRSGPIDTEEREHILIPLIRRYNGAG